MTLATAGADGRVSARTVDVKRLDDTGLVFGTSTLSPTGRQLAENPHAALQVYWRETMQQLRFEGVAVQLSDAESDALFADRSPKSRAATAVADQSAVLAPRSLQDLIDDAKRAARRVRRRRAPAGGLGRLATRAGRRRVLARQPGPHAPRLQYVRAAARGRSPACSRSDGRGSGPRS